MAFVSSAQRINAFYHLYFYCSTVLPDTSRKSRQKTRVVKRTANPMFNHTMVYDGFRPEDLKEACVEITVWDHDRLDNHYIGGLRLGLGTGEIQLYCSKVSFFSFSFFTLSSPTSLPLPHFLLLSSPLIHSFSRLVTPCYLIQFP